MRGIDSAPIGNQAESRITRATCLVAPLPQRTGSDQGVNRNGNPSEQASPHNTN